MTQDVSSVQQFILRAYAATGHARAEEYPLRNAFLVQHDEQPGEFLRLEGGAAEVPPGAEGAVKAIPFTGRGEQGLEQFDALSIRQDCRMDKDRIGAVFCFVEVGQSGQTLFFGWLERHLFRKRLQANNCLIHTSIIEQVF